jgi:hypothetical protein
MSATRGQELRASTAPRARHKTLEETHTFVRADVKRYEAQMTAVTYDWLAGGMHDGLDGQNTNRRAGADNAV